jgi:hypothetical protein
MEINICLKKFIHLKGIVTESSKRKREHDFLLKLLRGMHLYNIHSIKNLIYQIGLYRTQIMMMILNNYVYYFILKNQRTI